MVHLRGPIPKLAANAMIQKVEQAHNRAAEVNEALLVGKQREVAMADEVAVLADIYQNQYNMVVWQRQLSQQLQALAAQAVLQYPHLQIAMTVAPEDVLARLSQSLSEPEYQPLLANMAELVDMFACLFDLPRVGLRLKVLQAAMCPKFHVDKVPCRLVSTYHGEGSQWLEHRSINDRSQLGAMLSDSESGLYLQAQDVQQLHCGHVALLKGEKWLDNAQAGLVHRSPALAPTSQRLLLTLDFAD